MVEPARVISVVDDDPSLRRAVRNLLTSAGFSVETFASGEAFLGSVQRQDTGCLVLDLSMPEMNGFELLARLRNDGARIPTIVLTAHGDEEIRRRSLAAGAVAFLAKPFQADALVDAVHESLRRNPAHSLGTRPR
jgi:FixJ family two-component response regulator